MWSLPSQDFQLLRVLLKLLETNRDPRTQAVLRQVLVALLTALLSVLGYDPISVTLVRPDEAMADVCGINALTIAGWLVDVSIGGASVLVHRDALPEVEPGRRFFVSFALPAVEDETA